MYRNLKTWHRPERLDEAIDLLVRGKVVPHAGGTGLMTAGSDKVEGMVDLSLLPLDEMKKESGAYRIGACVTLDRLSSWPVLNPALSKNRPRSAGSNPPGQILAEAAGLAASASLRNRITLGGSVARPRPWSDLPPALLALDGSIEVEGSAGGRYGASEFFERNLLDGTSLVTAISIPKKSGGAAFRKAARTRFDYSVLDLAVFISLDGDRINEARVAAACALPKPMRIADAEEALAGQKASPDLFRTVAAETPFEPISDSRASAVYRRTLFRVHLRRCLEKAAARAGGEE